MSNFILLQIHFCILVGESMLAGNRALVLVVTWMIKKICSGRIILLGW